MTRRLLRATHLALLAVALACGSTLAVAELRARLYTEVEEDRLASVLAEEGAGASSGPGHLTGRLGIAPVNTYACSRAMSPMRAAPKTEYHQTRRKIGPSEWARSSGSS